jgi:hypothetical protein
MALNDDLDKSKKQLDELRKQYESISGLTSPFKNFKGDLNEANAAISQMQDLIDVAKTKASDIAVGFKRIVEEIRNTNKGLSGATSSFNKLSNLASKLQDHNTEIAELSLADLATLKQKTLQEKNRLEESQELLKTRIADLKAVDNRTKAEEKEFQSSISAHNEIEAILKSEDGLYSGLVSKIKEATEETEALEDATGLVGASVDGIDEGLKKAGFGKLAERLNLKGALGEGVKKAKELGINSKNAATGFQKFQIGTKIAGSAVGNLAKSFMKGGPIVVGIMLAVKLINFFKDAMFAASKQIAEFQRSFAMSREEASALRDRTNDIAGSSGTLLLTQKQITQSLQEMNKAFGIAFDFTTKMGAAGVNMLKDFTKLRDNFGLSGEALKGLTGESIRTGESIESISEEILGQTALLGLEKGVMVDMNSVLEEVGKLSGNIRANFAGGAGEIANAVVQAKFLGLTLEQSDKIAGSLLNFESSIASEMEAELLLGKQLNFEKARALAFDNDIVGATQEIIKQVGSYNDFLNMNRIEREAIAKAAGLTTDELADSLRKQEELNQLGGVALLLGKKTDDLQKQSLKNIFKEAEAIGSTREKIIELLGEEAYNRKLAEDASARFAKAMDRVREVFANLVDGGVLDSFARGLTEFAIRLDNEGMFEAITGMGVDSAETKSKIKDAMGKLPSKQPKEDKEEKFARSIVESNKELKEAILNQNNKEIGLYVSGNKLGNVVWNQSPELE